MEPNPAPPPAQTGGDPSAAARPARQAEARSGGRGVPLFIAMLILGALGATVALNAQRLGITRDTTRALAVAFLEVARFGHRALWLASFLGLVAGTGAIVSGLRNGRRPGAWAKVVLISAAFAVSLLAAEVVSAVVLARQRDAVGLPFQFSAPRDPAILRIAVVGESTGQGIPYDPWISIGELVGMGLREVFPDRRVEVQVLAKGGLSLEQALTFMGELKAPPDLILVVAGHNEFQAHAGWTRAVRYYQDEQPVPARRAWERFWDRVSPLGALLAHVIDNQRIDEPPPPQADRGIVDHPVVSADEYQNLKDDFERRLTQVCDYGERIGALTVLVAPAGNEVDFAPSRSYLARTVQSAERQRFAAEYESCRALEQESDPTAALAQYRSLSERYPEFAELHYRMGRLLRAQGDTDGARRELTLARDLDGLPLRCPSDFRASFPRTVQGRNALYVDGASAVSRLSPDGLIDDELMHDPQHPNLAGYIAMAQAVLDALARHQAFQWPPGRSAPQITADQALDLGQMSNERWSEVCRKTSILFTRLSQTHYDPRPSVLKAQQFRDAARAIRQGADPDSCGVPGIGNEATRRLLTPTRTPARPGS